MIGKAICSISRGHKANDTGAGCRVFKEMLQKYPTLKGVCADAGYRTPMEAFVRNILNKTIVISEHISQGWAIIPKC
ncbi:hypothetical protein [Holospora elegans]|uniref:hypothetical protein n=1 Tax=Holospora elegans TaxID=431043 RepID=UPI001FA7F83E|nr:hypothetical protein [Holospora elegans]